MKNRHDQLQIGHHQDLRNRAPSASALHSARVVLAAVGLALVPLQAALASTPERPVHRYLEVRLSPDAQFVAAIEGDSPKGGYYPEVRDLVIRRVTGNSEIRVSLPCGRVPQCWPGSLAWKPDGKLLAFTLRTPGSHTYTLYSVAPDGSGLTK